MDQIFFSNLGSTLNTLTENTQRNSDAVGAEHAKSRKEKARNLANVDSADISSEAALSDDLMGSMDPDLFGGKKRRNYKTEEDEENAASEPPLETDEPGSEAEPAENPASEDEGQSEGRSESKPPPGWTDEADGLAGELSGEGPDTTEAPAELVVSLERGPEEDGEPVVDGSDEVVRLTRLESEGEDALVQPGDVQLPPAEDARHSGELELPPSVTGDTDPSAAVGDLPAEDRHGEVPPDMENADDTEFQSSTDDAPRIGGGLLFFDEGYIIAEPTRPRRSSDRQRPRRPANVDRVEVEDRPVARQLSQVLDEMVLCGEPCAALERLRSSLSRFGVRLLSQCRTFGIRVLLAGDDIRPSSLCPRLASQRGKAVDDLPAAYFPEEKLCYLTRAIMEKPPHFGDIAILTFATALDHCMGGDGFASIKSPAVLASYQACKTQQPGQHFLDGLCARSPLHYFAQAVEAYLTQEHGPLKETDTDTYCSRSQLYDLDRTIYGYMEHLFRP